MKKVLKSVCFARDCNGTRTHNQLSCKRTFNHFAKLAKWLSCFVSTYLYGAFNCLYGVSVCHYIGCGFTLKCVRDMIRTYSQCLFYVKYHINKFRGNSIATRNVKFEKWSFFIKIGLADDIQFHITTS